MINIEVTNMMEYGVMVDVKIGEDLYGSFTATANTTSTSTIEGYDGITVWLEYTVIGNDEITLEADEFFGVESYVNVNLFPEGSSMNSYQ